MSGKREHTLQDSIEEVRRVSEERARERARARDEEERERRMGPILGACLAALFREFARNSRFVDVSPLRGQLRFRSDEREYTITVTLEDA